MSQLLDQAARWIREADALVLTAGAGMGVDSGLPDFRGDQGFWKAYPALGNAGIRFTDIANPAAFRRSPRQAWGFYGHRLALYRRTVPHAGFAVLARLAAQRPAGAFVVTSNVDGQFTKAGFGAGRILEIHGSIHYLQCCLPCSDRLWPADDLRPETDDPTCTWLGELPTCPDCGGLARPNILMFGDAGWLERREAEQAAHWQAWRRQAGSVVVVECGAGVDIPSIRHIGERQDGPVIRINPRQADVPAGRGIGLAMGALEALRAIEARLNRGD